MANGLKNAVRLGWIPVAIAAIYVGWIFYSRHVEVEEQKRQAIEKEAEDSRKVLDRLGGDSLKISNFFANPPVTKKGGTILLCYGVLNATKVSIAPDGPSIHPSLSYCAEAKPAKSTTYVLTAEDNAGHKVSAEVNVTVR